MINGEYEVFKILNNGRGGGGGVEKKFIIYGCVRHKGGGGRSKNGKWGVIHSKDT